MARLVAIMDPRIPKSWPGANLTIVRSPSGTRILITNLQNDDEVLEVNQEIADRAMALVRLTQPAVWEAAQFRLTRKNESEWTLETHFE